MTALVDNQQGAEAQMPRGLNHVVLNVRDLDSHIDFGPNFSASGTSGLCVGPARTANRVRGCASTAASVMARCGTTT